MDLDGNGAIVLVIEDDPTTRNTIRDYLVRARFSVRTAVNGWEALKRLKETPVDAVIMSGNVQDTDGCSLRERFVLNPESREIPFIFLVQHDEPESAVRALRSGVDDCIEKPFDPVVLVARVQATLERRKSYLRMVRVDPMTRMLNRPTFEQELSDELKRVVRYARHGSVVFLDMDGYAEVNAQHGFEMGDLMLTCLAGVILTRIRSSDIAGRLSGEKFMLYLPETNEDGARRLVERIQERVRQVGDSVAGIPLSLSAGVVGVPSGGADTVTLYRRAFAAVKRAKSREAGCVAVWEPAMEEEAPAKETPAE